MGKSKPAESTAISIDDLFAAIDQFPADAQYARRGGWVGSTKDQWLGWLAQYDTPGYYDRIGLNLRCVNAGVFLALCAFCRTEDGYRPAGAIPWIAHALAFKAGRDRCTDDEQRLLLDEYEEDLEAGYQSAGLGPGATG